MFRLLPLLVLIVARTAWAMPPDLQVSTAIRHYDGGEFQDAKDLLVTVVESPRLRPSQRSRARIYLAASYYALGDVASCKAQLLILARLHPKATLDPAVFVPELIALFEEAQAEVAADAQDGFVSIVEEPHPPGYVEPAPPPQQPPAAFVPPPLGLAFIPFGGGQFANGDPARGWLYLGAQTAAYTTAAVTLGVFESKKEPGGQFLVRGVFRDPVEAEKLQRLYLTAFWVGNALVAAGIVDALVSRRAAEPPASGLRLTGTGVEVRFE